MFQFKGLTWMMSQYDIIYVTIYQHSKIQIGNSSWNILSLHQTRKNSYKHGTGSKNWTAMDGQEDFIWLTVLSKWLEWQRALQWCHHKNINASSSMQEKVMLCMKQVSTLLWFVPLHPILNATHKNCVFAKVSASQLLCYFYGSLGRTLLQICNPCPDFLILSCFLGITI